MLLWELVLPDRTKILFIISKMGKGGAQQIVVDLIRGLAQRGFQVDLMILYRSPQDRYFLQQIVDISSLISLQEKPIVLENDFSSYWLRIWTLFKTPLLVIKFVLKRRHEQYHIIHSHLLVASIVSWLVKLFAKLFNKNAPFFVETFHADFTVTPKLQKVLFFFLWQHLDLLITELSRRDYREISLALSKVKVEYIPFGVSPLSRTGVTQENDFRNRYGLLSNRPVIVTISRVNIREKKIDKLLRIVAKLKEFNVDFYYLICGDGPDIDASKKLANDLGISDSVKFLGYVDEIKEPLSVANIFLIAGVEDLVGIAALQAASLGVPVVSLQTDDRWSGDNKFFWNSLNIDEIAHKIKSLLHDDEYYTECSNSCRKVFQNHFSVDSMVSSYARLYNSMHENRSQ